MKYFKKMKYKKWDFPGGPMPKIPSSQCRGPGFNLCSEN